MLNLKLPPVAIGLIRGVVEAALMSGIAYLTLVLPDVLDSGAWQVYAPLLLAALRTLEGLADNIDPSRSRS